MLSLIIRQHTMKVTPTTLAVTVALASSRNATPARAFTNAAAVLASNTDRAMSSTAAESTTTMENPLLASSGLPKFTKIEPSQLTPAMTEILAKLESDFAAKEEELSKAASVAYDDVVPAVERMQHPLGE